MNGIEKITQQLNTDAQAEIDRILTQNNQKNNA